MSQIDLVTGAFGYSGTYLRRRLEQTGRTVRSLTDHPGSRIDRQIHQASPIESFRYGFDDPAVMKAAFDGVTTFYNTYWVRYPRAGASHEQAVENTAVLLAAARRAGVERIVQISVSNPDPDSFYGYYRGKAAVESLVRDCGIPYAIVRPGVIFGGDCGHEDILLNNIAWLIRRFRVFAIPGDGTYRLRPVHVQDLADLCVGLGAGRADTVVDAIGPEWFTFEGLVRAIAAAIGVRVLPVHLPAGAVSLLLRGLALLTRDDVLTRDELAGLMAELVMVEGEPTCPTRLTDYLRENAGQIGRRYHSELARRR